MPKTPLNRQTLNNLLVIVYSSLAQEINQYEPLEVKNRDSIPRTPLQSHLFERNSVANFKNISFL